MNLYFLDENDNQHLVAEDVEEKAIGNLINIDLVTRIPGFEVYYNTRQWWDSFLRMWIDFGSHTQFYLYQDPNKALNIVEDQPIDIGGCESCKIE